MKKNRLSLVQLLCILLIISMLPLLAVNFAINRKNSNLVYEDVCSSASANVVYLSDQMDEVVYGILLQMELLLNNSDVQSVFTLRNFMTTSEYYMTIRDVLNYMSLIVNGNSFISEIMLYYPQLGIYLNSNAPHMRTASPEQIAARMEITCVQPRLFSENGHLKLYRTVTGSHSPSSKPLYHMEVTLKEESLESMLSSFGQFSASNAVLIHNSTNSIFRSRACIPLNEEQSSLLIEHLSDADDSVRQIPFQIGEQDFTVFYRRSAQNNCTFAQLVPNERIFGVTNRMNRLTALYTLICCAIFIAFFLMLRHYLYQPVNMLLSSFQNFGLDTFNVRLNPDARIMEFQRLQDGFNQMAKRIDTLVESNYRQEILVQRSRLKHLQAQISPHLLYNSFFFLENMLETEDLESAQKFLRHLANYYQFITWNDPDTIPLGQEYAHLLDYISIQQMRFGSTLQIRMSTLPDDWKDTSVPRLIFQPLVENALEYSRASLQAAVICIDLWVDGDTLQFRCSDNGTSLTDEGLSNIRSIISDASLTSSALSNISERLYLFYGKKNCMNACRSSMGGLEIQMTLYRKGVTTNG